VKIRSNIPWIPICLALALLGVSAGAQVPGTSSWEPARHNGESLTLIDAVQLALAHNPELRLEEETTRLQAGFYQEASGRFDATLFSDLSFDNRRQGLLASQLAEELKVRTDLDADIRRSQERLAFNTLVLQELQSLQSDPTDFRVSDPGVQALIDLLNLQIANSSGSLRDELINLRNQAIGNAIASVSEDRAEILLNLEDEILDRQNLGDVPREQESYFGRYTLRYARPLRSGITVAPFFDYTLSGDRFVGKPVDTDFGGKGALDVYRGELGVGLNVPLGRGLGRVSAAADETAARFTWNAGRANLQHAGATTALGATVTYWDVVAAQDRLRVLEELAALQERMVELTGLLIRADEIAPTEMARSRARHAEIASQLAQARRAEQSARIALADTLGLSVASLDDAPRAADSFPPPAIEQIRELDTSELIAAALRQRDDYVAAQILVESSETLVRAARANLRPIVDLEARTWMSGVGENDARGAVSDRWVAPSYQFALHVDLPFANNTQRGRWVQAGARDRQQRISTGDLERRIRLSVIELVSTLQLAAEQVRLANEAAERYHETMEAELELLRSGESTVVNTLLTEQRLTESRLAGVAAQQLYAQLLAQLRFVSGTLITPRGENGVIEQSTLLTPPANGSGS
jgi:outer membrane protein TolC